MESIQPNEFVIEYCGELIRKPVGDVREGRYERLDMDSSYLFRISDEYVVDATLHGHLARYINHSCQPNCYTHITDWGRGR